MDLHFAVISTMSRKQALAWFVMITTLLNFLLALIEYIKIIRKLQK